MIWVDHCYYLIPNINNKPLSDEGLTYLLFYFANLVGKKDLTYEERIQWTRDNIMNIYENYIQIKNIY